MPKVLNNDVYHFYVPRMQELVKRPKNTYEELVFSDGVDSVEEFYYLEVGSTLRPAGRISQLVLLTSIISHGSVSIWSRERGLMCTKTMTVGTCAALDQWVKDAWLIPDRGSPDKLVSGVSFKVADKVRRTFPHMALDFTKDLQQ